MTLPKGRSKFPRPQRTNAGIVFPEFVLHAALADLPQKLGDGVYNIGASEEPIFTIIRGLSQELVEATFDSLRNRPPSVSLTFPESDKELPTITVVNESQPQEHPIIGADAGQVEPDFTVVEESIVLSADGGAVGGETEFQLPTRDVISNSVELNVERAGEDIPLYHVEDEFSVDSASGKVTLADALVAGDVLTLEKYAYEGLHGGDLYGTIFTFENALLIDTDSPRITMVLAAICWRELVLASNSMIAAGLADLEFTRRALSPWDAYRLPIGYRTDLVVTGKAEWTVYSRLDPIRTINLDYDGTDGTEDVLQMSTDLVVYTSNTDND